MIILLTKHSNAELGTCGYLNLLIMLFFAGFTKLIPGPESSLFFWNEIGLKVTFRNEPHNRKSKMLSSARSNNNIKLYNNIMIMGYIKVYVD